MGRVILLIVVLMFVSCSRENEPTLAETPGDFAASNGDSSASLSRIISELDKCVSREEFIRPIDHARCNDAARDATYNLLPRSPANRSLNKFLSDLADSETQAMAYGPYGSLAKGEYGNMGTETLTVSGTTMKFAIERAAILRGSSVRHPDDHKLRRRAKLFSWLAPYGDPKAFERQWAAIRNMDCQAYVVPNCAAQLDDAIRKAYDIIDG